MVFITFLTFFLSMGFADTGVEEYEVEEYEIDEELIKYEQMQIKKKSKFTNHFKLTCGFNIDLQENAEPEVLITRNGASLVNIPSVESFSIELPHISTKDLVKLAHSKAYKFEKKIGRTDFILEIDVTLHHYEFENNEKSSGLTMAFQIMEKNKIKEKQSIKYMVDVTKNRPNRFSIGSTKEFISLDNSKIKFSQFCY